MTDPHKKYLDDLVIQLRLLDVDGETIGAALEEARDHLAVSGEDPNDAFGTAADYARDLAEARGLAGQAPMNRGVAVLGLCVFLSCYLFLMSLFAHYSNRGVAAPSTGLLMGSMLALLVAVFVVWPVLVRHLEGKLGLWAPVVSIVLGVLGVGYVSVRLNQSVVFMIMRGPQIPAWVGMVASGVAGVVCLVWMLRLRDPIRDPIRRRG